MAAPRVGAVARVRAVLSPAALLATELDLRGYRAARRALHALDEAARGLLCAPTASLSYIGRSQGQPGDPTYRRARALAALTSRQDVRYARRLVPLVDEWLARMPHRDDRILVGLRYGLEDGLNRTVADAAAGARIPCGSAAEERAVRAHLRRLCEPLARGLGHVRKERARVEGWEVGRSLLLAQ
ncbi:MAG: hypothetical protein KGK07_14430 [Chloroflexota bacterium]|nr:hypothetical protein [Chloroflexota bacterium]